MPVEVVDARTLWQACGSSRIFNNWIKYQIIRCKLTEGTDYKTFLFSIPGKIGRPQVDYTLTVDAAKHICMVQGTEKAHEIRQYLIAAALPLLGTTDSPASSRAPSDEDATNRGTTHPAQNCAPACSGETLLVPENCGARAQPKPSFALKQDESPSFAFQPSTRLCFRSGL